MRSRLIVEPTGEHRTGRALLSLLWLILAASHGCAVVGKSPLALADAQAAATDARPPAIDWNKEIGAVIVPAGGALHAALNEKEQVYTISIPRADLEVTIDGMSVPTAAGIGSTFHFYRCSCGKMSVLGEFIVVDYEANDVIDALRAGNAIRIGAVNAIAIGDRPRLLSVRFHGEGEAAQLARLVREARRWTGEERMKPGTE